ncbi:MAG: Rpn family recombination-promoting nuclease/putative transposase [Bacteroidia bacterium]
MKFADVKNDIAFRKIFGNQNKKEVLISFLNAVLDFGFKHKITDVTIINPYQLPKFRDGKATIIDVKAKDQNGREFIVEMQVADAWGFSKRVLYYTSQGYVSQIDRGEFYDTLNPTIFIGILDFRLSQNPRYISRHRILDVETGERIMEDMEFNFIELPKFKLGRNDLKTLVEKWVFFIKEAENLEVIPEEIDDPGLLTAFEEANIQTWSQEELEAYDYAGLRETEDRLRLEKAKVEAIKESRITMARQMKSDNMETEIIKKYTGLTDEELDMI